VLAKPDRKYFTDEFLNWTAIACTTPARNDVGDTPADVGVDDGGTPTVTAVGDKPRSSNTVDDGDVGEDTDDSRRRVRTLLKDCATGSLVPTVLSLLLVSLLQASGCYSWNLRCGEHTRLCNER